MKTLRFNRCKDVPAPFWLFVLEETRFRNKSENPNHVAQYIEIEQKWQNVKQFYKEEVRKLKNEIKLCSETSYVLMTIYERHVHTLSIRNLVRTARKFDDYLYNVCSIDQVNTEDLSCVDTFWELYENRRW